MNKEKKAGAKNLPSVYTWASAHTIIIFVQIYTTIDATQYGRVLDSRTYVNVRFSIKHQAEINVYNTNTL